MAEKKRLSKQTFLQMARASGLDTSDPHMEDLYSFVQNVFQGLQTIEELDLGETEPVTTFIPSKE